MGLTPIPGMPNYSGAPTFLIPPRFAASFLKKYYLMTTFREICNTDFDKDIVGFGDKLYVRRVPTITNGVWNPGSTLATQTDMAIAAVSLDIDHARYWRFPMDPVLLKQTDRKELFDTWATDAAKNVDISVETEMYSVLPTLADASNAGAAAGAVTGMWDLGTSGAPLTISPDDCVPLLLAFEQCLFENNIIIGKHDGKSGGQENKAYAVCPGWFISYLMQAKILQAIYTGDASSPIRTNAVGTVGPITIYRSNNLPYTTATKESPIIFGVKQAVSFAMQLDLVEEKDNFTGFGKLMQGLVVYGYAKMQAKGLGVAYVTPGSVVAPAAEG